MLLYLVDICVSNKPISTLVLLIRRHGLPPFWFFLNKNPSLTGFYASAVSTSVQPRSTSGRKGSTPPRSIYSIPTSHHPISQASHHPPHHHHHRKSPHPRSRTSSRESQSLLAITLPPHSTGKFYTMIYNYLGVFLSSWGHINVWNINFYCVAILAWNCLHDLWYKWI
jgi:hypothetical protein